MSWLWQDETDLPAPQGVVGVGATARRLLAVAERLAQTAQEGLMATANDDVLVLTGTEHLLPWADGVQYISPRVEVPALWLPTTLRPAVPLDLLARAIQRKHPVQPVALLREPAQLIPLNRLLPANAALLMQIRERWRCDLRYD